MHPLHCGVQNKYICRLGSKWWCWKLLIGIQASSWDAESAPQLKNRMVIIYPAPSLQEDRQWGLGLRNTTQQDKNQGDFKVRSNLRGLPVTLLLSTIFETRLEMAHVEDDNYSAAMSWLVSLIWQEFLQLTWQLLPCWWPHVNDDISCYSTQKLKAMAH